MTRTLADLRKLAKPVTASVTLQLDGSLAAQQAEVRRRLVAARQAAAQAMEVSEDLGASLAEPATRPQDQVVQLEAQLEELEQAGQNTVATFTAQAIGQLAFEELALANPPTAQQAKDDLRWNPDTFGPALVAACMVDPEMTAQEAQQVWREWSPGVVNRLYRLCWDVCQTAPVATPLSDSGSAATPLSDGS